MNRLKRMCKIYIIESQSPQDILDKRMEGIALSNSLNLAGVKNDYYQIVNFQTFERCLSLICKDILENKNNKLIAPYIHISAHGDKNGIYLTNNDFLSWEYLSQKTNEINNIIGRVERHNISIINYCFSTCEGYYAYKMQDYFEDNLYTATIGPIEKVDWSDSLIAYITFYHQVFYKAKKAIHAIEIMNNAAGLNDIFKVSTGNGITVE